MNLPNMNEVNRSAFTNLFREACLKCFGYPLTSILTEADSRLLSNKIFDQTGLVIGPKSIKNYSLYILDITRTTKKENPSLASLDTLARYVLDAPHTNELKRKQNESHYPYWFQYREKNSGKRSSIPHFRISIKSLYLFAGLVIVSVLILVAIYFIRTRSTIYSDNFNSVSEDSLKSRGWIVKSEDTIFWARRNEKPGHIALFTQTGDNWGLNENKPSIRNLLIRKINDECFNIEIHLTDFMPEKNWQQAGILLSEDPDFKGKMIRLSISYNDFFGGYNKPPEIIIQAVSSSESGHSKPEETGHVTLFSLDSKDQSL